MRTPCALGRGVAGILLLITACGGAQDEMPEEQADTQAPPAMAADTTAAGLWTHLQGANYRTSWAMWPGKGRLYTGMEPHGMLLTTYVNETARAALAAGQVGSLPAGSIIVKENWMADSTFAGATVMYKVAGYNPDHQNWLFAKYDPAGAAEAFGRAGMCQDCHRTGTGYVMTAVP